MKIKFGKLFIILVLSSIIGLIYNYINPSGLSLLSKNKELKWANDSLLTAHKNSYDSLKTERAIKPNNVKKIDGNDKNIAKNNEGHKEKNVPVNKEQNEDSGFSEPLAINLEQAYKLYQMDALFIDARDQTDYNAGHIKKSISLPFIEFDKYKSVLLKIPKSQTIIAYCGGADCELSKGLANKLLSLGYHNIYVFFGGWGQWKNADYPVD